MKDSSNKIQESQNNGIITNKELIPNINNNPIIQEVNELLMDQEQILKKILSSRKNSLHRRNSIIIGKVLFKTDILFLIKSKISEFDLNAN